MTDCRDNDSFHSSEWQQMSFSQIVKGHNMLDISPILLSDQNSTINYDIFPGRMFIEQNYR